MEVLYVLLVLLLVTKLCAEVAVRVGQPALIGELVGGILVGLGLMLLPNSETAIAHVGSDQTFDAILDLAVFFLMLVAGLEMRPGKLAKAARTAIPIAVAGMLLPLALGFWLGWIWLPESEWKPIQSLFLGVALAITAVPVAVKVLMDLGRLESRVGQVVVAAAVLDDIFSLLLLAVLTSMISSAEAPSVTALTFIALKTLLFLGVAVLSGRYLLPVLGRWAGHIYVEHAEFTVILVFGLGLAVLAELLGMHFLIGAFAAGVLFTRNTIDPDSYSRLRKQFEVLTLGFFAPVFFASIGIQLDLTAAFEIPLFVLTLVTFAIFGKLFGAGLAAWLSGLKKRDAVAVGAAMNARGAGPSDFVTAVMLAIAVGVAPRASPA